MKVLVNSELIFIIDFSYKINLLNKNIVLTINI